MPFKNNVIKLNSIGRNTIAGQSYIVLDNQQDALNYVHYLELIPANRVKTSNGGSKVVFPAGESQFLRHSAIGQFPIDFEMQTQFGYLVIGIVPKDLVPDFGLQNHFPQQNGATQTPSFEVGPSDREMTRQWIAEHNNWVQKNGIIIHA